MDPWVQFRGGFNSDVTPPPMGKSNISPKGWKGTPCKKLERWKEQNEAEHGESTINSLHILVIPLGSIDSVLYPVFTPYCKQCTGFFALPPAPTKADDKLIGSLLI